MRVAPGKVFYGWWIVGSGMVLTMLGNALLMQSYGTYVVALREQFGWSKTALSAAFAMSRTETGLLGPLEGWLIERFGPKALLRVGLIIFGLGFIAFSQLNSLPVFYVTFLVMSLGASVGGWMPLSVAIVQWFEKRRARALGLLSMGSAVGGLVVPLVALSIDNFGWRETAFASGVLIMVIGLPATSLVRYKPEQYGLTVDGLPPEVHADGDTSAFGRVNFSLRQALRTRTFWFLSIAHACALLVVSAVMVHLVAHVNENLGYSLATAGLVVSMLTATQMAGMVVGGYLGDKFSKRWLCFGCMGGHALGLLLLAYAQAFWMIVAFAILHGLAWGIRGPLMSAMRADYFGRASFGMVMGFSSMIVSVGMITGPLVAGILADTTGNYESGFTVLAAGAALGSVFFALATKPPPPVTRAGAPPAELREMPPELATGTAGR